MPAKGMRRYSGKHVSSVGQGMKCQKLVAPRGISWPPTFPDSRRGGLARGPGGKQPIANVTGEVITSKRQRWKEYLRTVRITERTAVVEKRRKGYRLLVHLFEKPKGGQRSSDGFSGARESNR